MSLLYSRLHDTHLGTDFAHPSAPLNLSPDRPARELISSRQRCEREARSLHVNTIPRHLSLP